MTGTDRRGDLVLESCHTTWVFDTACKRYRRILKGMGTAYQTVTGWRPYHRLDLTADSESFVVWLDAGGWHRLRSWRHRGHCAQCESGAASS